MVFLDTDLEFHRFPTLFVPGSWPNGPRDMAIFNYWGNETDPNLPLTLPLPLPPPVPLPAHLYPAPTPLPPTPSPTPNLRPTLYP